MKRLVLTKNSDLDLKDALEYYNWKQRGLDDRFYNNFFQKIEKILDNPLTYAIRYENIRCAKINYFPFMVHFINQPDTIVVIGILHTSRNPKLWKEREK